MDKFFNSKFAIFAVLALLVLGGFFFFGGDDAASTADNSFDALDQVAAVDEVTDGESVDGVTEEEVE